MHRHGDPEVALFGIVLGENLQRTIHTCSHYGTSGNTYEGQSKRTPKHVGHPPPSRRTSTQSPHLFTLPSHRRLELVRPLLLQVKVPVVVVVGAAAGPVASLRGGWDGGREGG